MTILSPNIRKIGEAFIEGRHMNLILQMTPKAREILAFLVKLGLKEWEKEADIGLEEGENKAPMSPGMPWQDAERALQSWPDTATTMSRAEYQRIKNETL